eukprot:363340-Chlamydomonas_euryale.AAC.4
MEMKQSLRGRVTQQGCCAVHTRFRYCRPLCPSSGQTDCGFSEQRQAEGVDACVSWGRGRGAAVAGV